MSNCPSPLSATDTFARRHIGPSPGEQREMLAALGLPSLDALIEATVPAAIRLNRALALPAALSESECLAEMAALAGQNAKLKSFLGMGYHGCHVPGVIQRNVLENPGWYTAYTPYQAEIAQGRLEALLNYQTMVCDLTALPLANASLLDEGTAAAEAMAMACEALRGARQALFVSERCHPQTIEVVRTRAAVLGHTVIVGDHERFDFGRTPVYGALVQYPTTDGFVLDYAAFAERAHAAGALVIAACDPLALVLLRAPGEWGADIAVGSAQRFGVPMGFGGPHAAFLATREEYKRVMPGRLIGLSKDAHGKPALRMALQTREQHIRREKATSNICTAQVLLAVMSGLYAAYHGPAGLRAIAQRVHTAAHTLAQALTRAGARIGPGVFFDTLRVELPGKSADALVASARAAGLLVRKLDAQAIGIALDETSTSAELAALVQALCGKAVGAEELERSAAELGSALPAPHARSSAILQHAVFQRYHSEHEMLRYLHRLEARDLSLNTSMIPLGSCTMKLNATTEMAPVTWPGFADLHPFTPLADTQGYQKLFAGLEAALREITGFAGISLQPNAGSQGEYAGLLVIRAWHASRGEAQRDVCLIPVSAHGTNPASAVMCGLEVVAVACDEHGNVDLADLAAKAEQHRERLAALMVTYPSTHGVFETQIRDICRIVHERGGQVYMDGANMNAQVGLCRPADFGADVCHLNLHKTFCIPHGGGGPGMGPIGVAKHLVPFLPGHPLVATGGAQSLGPVSSAPWGSALILTISYAYVRMMGAEGLRAATAVAILNANYMARRLEQEFEVLYRGANGRVAHEFILDLRPFEKSAGVTAEDVAKRLMDYGFHAPTVSFPVGGTLMIEPTESEGRAELDRLCDALLAIRAEIRAIEQGRADRKDNPLKHAPHALAVVCADSWTHAYSREQAAFPASWTREHKHWPHVSRIDNGYGDRNLVCTCPPMEAYGSAAPAAAALVGSST